MLSPETIDRIRPYVNEYGYFSIFFGVMLENLGIPIPGETILIIGGALAGTQLLEFHWVILCTIAGAILGDNFGYWIGLKGGRKLLVKYGHYILIREKQLQKAEEYFAKFGDVTIFFARFITGIRVFGAILAGASKMHWKRFFIFNAAGATAWAFTFGTLGYYFAKSIHLLGHYIIKAEIAIIIILILAIVLFWKKKIPRPF